MEYHISSLQLIPKSARYNVWVFGLSFAAIAGCNPTGCIDACLLWILCVVRYLRRADHPSRGVLPSVACLSVIVKLRHWRRPAPLGVVVPWVKKKISSREVYTNTNTHFSPFNLHVVIRSRYRSSVSHWNSCSFEDTNSQIHLMPSNCTYCEYVPVGTQVTISGSVYCVAGVDQAENTTPVW